MKKYKELIFGGGIIALIVAFFAIFNIPCIVRLFTGVSCPGCGMTRAYICLLHLDFERAFYYHPLWWLVPVAACLIFMFYKKPIARNTVIVICCVLMISMYILRWIYGSGEIVYVDFTQTIWYKMYEVIL